MLDRADENNLNEIFPNIENMENFVLLDRWTDKFKVHTKIIAELTSLQIKFMYADKLSNHKFYKYSKWYGTHNRLFNLPDESDIIIFFLVGNVSKDYFMKLLSEILVGLDKRKTIYVLLNGKKNPYFDYLPKQITIIHKFQGESYTLERRKYQKKNMYQKIKRLIRNIPNLPIPPKAIYGYGSFFREKEIIGDIDLYIEYDQEHPRWKKFYSFFRWDDKDSQAEKKVENYHKLREIIQKERELERKNSDHLRRFQVKCQEETFQKKIQQFDLDIELLQYCTWGQLCGDQDYYYGFYFRPSIENIFKKSFKTRKTGININPFNSLDDGKNYILLWSQEKPDFETNYQDWFTNEKDRYIRKEYLHLVEEIDRWIEYYKEEKRYTESHLTQQLETFDSIAISKFTNLKSKYSPSIESKETYNSLSKKVNRLRDSLKTIVEEAEKQKDRILFYDEFNNSMWNRSKRLAQELKKK
jgi:hypothetical protein